MAFHPPAFEKITLRIRRSETPGKNPYRTILNKQASAMREHRIFSVIWSRIQLFFQQPVIFDYF